ncbi:MAG TPA: BatA and WFA domain-containing protein [Chthonomonadaceae bacterium]|nr:BatA and WFA domain-containing protein [Chthonomonadaceae bacterium]
MHFISPLNLLWLLPIGGLIVLMYILKLRRKDVLVSSTFLWRQVIRDVQANAPFQKLRKNLLLFLQLLVAALIIFALSRPFVRAMGFGGRNIVLLVDTSASMRATDVAPSRLEAARRTAHELVGQMRPGDRMMVLSASARPEALTGFTEERAELHRAIDSLKPHDTPTNMRDALNLAADLVAARKEGDSGRIELISDGGFEAQDGGAGSPNAAPRYALTNINLGKTHVAFHPIGKGHDNVGITAVDFRRSLGGEKSLQLLVVTHNYSDKPRTFNEEIYADDNLAFANEVSLPPNGEDTQPYDMPEPDRPIKLRVRLDLKDDLAADNEAALIVKPRKTLRVLLVGKENLFLEDALKVDPSVELSKAAAFSAGKGFDVVVFNETAPARLPAGNYLFIHCTSDQAPVKVEGAAANVAPADWEREHPVLRYVDFGSDRFGDVLKAEPLGWGRELAVAESGSLVAVGEKEKMRSEFVAFALNQSSFPLRVAFPIFIANSVRWLGMGSDDSELGQIATGSPITVPSPPGLGKLTVTRPDGSKREVRAGERGGAAFDETDQVGFYTAEGPGFSYSFAANLASASESDITPHRELTITDNPAGSRGRRVADNRELLPWLALLALAVLCVEWWAFHRRVYVN